MSQDSLRDNIFASRQEAGDFVFDDKVASVFTDMINRSVPGYATTLSMIGVLASRYCKPGSRLYDLGCSLGGASLAMAHQIPHQDYELIAIDNSAAMIDRLNNRLESEEHRHLPITTHLGDICEADIANASVVVLNFTLQFIPLAQRQTLIQRIADGM